MKTTLRRFSPGKNIVIILNVVFLIFAVYASFVKGRFNAGPILFIALPIWAILFGGSTIWNVALWASGLLVGISFLIGTAGTYSELTGGQRLGESLGVAAILLLFTLPTFLHLYFNQPDFNSTTDDQGGVSSSDETHREVLAKVKRQEEEAARPAEERLPKGVCPSCRETILLSSQECKFCKAYFGPHSTWHVLPTSDA